MSYQTRFAPLDRLITHLDSVVPSLADPFLRSHYVGFLCVSVVTVFELCAKDIFCTFAEKKHKSFGAYCSNVFEKMNGRISISDLKDVHAKKFGEKYVRRLAVRLDAKEKESLINSRISIKSSYGNVIVWRNSFAHEGVLPANASYGETRKGYECGKHVLECLDFAMTR